ncbi:MAG: sulfatase-like hydrolase/transferase [Lewinellaceae bacterium]|nr:sulfatase-like hydrolase/transferase [Lewinellaceae bacterium]
MKILRQYIPAHLRFLLVIHVLLVSIFTVFRAITLLYNRPSYFFDLDHSIFLWKAFRIGFWFDVTIASYALVIPYCLLTAVYLFQIDYRRFFTFVRFYCSLAIFVSLTICAADIPYFNFFNSRLTTAAVHWKNNLQVARYVLSEIQYYPVFFVIILCIWGVGKLVKGIWQITFSPTKQSLFRKISVTVLASMLLLGGIWGGAVPKHLDMKRAYFSNDGFINQLTLNPVHTWFDSYSNFDIHSLSFEASRTSVQRMFRAVAKSNIDSPIRREHRFVAQERKMNVVLVMMESMSANRMSIYGNSQIATPGLDSLARHSIFFNNFYSNGIHTNAGLYASCTACPS